MIKLRVACSWAHSVSAAIVPNVARGAIAGCFPSRHIHIPVVAGLKDYGTVSSAIRRFERSLANDVGQAHWKLRCEKYKNQM